MGAAHHKIQIITAAVLTAYRLVTSGVDPGFSERGV